MTWSPESFQKLCEAAGLTHALTRSGVLAATQRCRGGLSANHVRGPFSDVVVKDSSALGSPEEGPSGGAFPPRGQGQS